MNYLCVAQKQETMPYLYDPETDIDRLLELPQFNIELPERKSVLKYVILMNDPFSSIIRTHPDIIKRKKEAAKLAKFETTRTGGMSEFTQSVLLGKNKIANELTLSYLKLFNNPWLLKYKAGWNLMEREILDSEDLSVYSPKERETISNNIEKLTNRIDECERHIFNGMESDNLRNALFEDMEREREVRLRPEFMSVDLENKTAEIGNSPFYPKIS